MGFTNKDTAALYEMTGSHDGYTIVAERWEGKLRDAPPEVVAHMIETRSDLVKAKSAKAAANEAPAAPVRAKAPDPATGDAEKK